ncbi:hypothetical protein V7O66_13410 [Methanolobus sp. ZRKC3]|uniref:hypothetical protein n=1 Tax=Methanolobus sp. ZRKC3 TaxID=3125786 RepID=UPI0032535799
MENDYGKYITRTAEGFYNVKLPGVKMMHDSRDFFVLDVRPHSLFAPFHLKVL